MNTKRFTRFVFASLIIGMLAIISLTTYGVYSQFKMAQLLEPIDKIDITASNGLLRKAGDYWMLLGSWF